MQMGLNSKTSSSDPRDASAIQRYEHKINPDELPSDVFAMISLMAGMIGMFFKMKMACWVGLFACMANVANMSRYEYEFKQAIVSFM